MASAADGSTVKADCTWSRFASRRQPLPEPGTLSPRVTDKKRAFSSGVLALVDQEQALATDTSCTPAFAAFGDRSYNWS